MRQQLTPLAMAICALGLAHGAAQAQFKEPATVKIGFITDMSSLYADVEGKHGATAIQMAIDDFGGKVLGKPIELMTADHQNKADIAASKAREWIDSRTSAWCLAAPTAPRPWPWPRWPPRRSASSWTTAPAARP
jgi:branched-chain amino acid transport system substrate-binding protein